MKDISLILKGRAHHKMQRRKKVALSIFQRDAFRAYPEPDGYSVKVFDDANVKFGFSKYHQEWLTPFNDLQ